MSYNLPIRATVRLHERGEWRAGDGGEKMTTVNTLIKRHPVLLFYVVVFGISWGGFLLAVGPTTAMAVVGR